MSNKAELSKVANRYAEALAAISIDEKILKDLESVRDVFTLNSELSKFFEHPAVKLEDQKEALNKLFSGKVDDNVLKLLKVLLEKRRLKSAAMLAEHYKAIVYKNKGIEIAKISSAKELNSDELNKIKTELENVFKKDIEIESELDESLIAGLKVNVADKVIDSSIKNKLKQVKQLIK